MDPSDRSGRGERPRVVVCASNVLVRHGLYWVLHGSRAATVVGSHRKPAELAGALTRSRPEAIVLDAGSHGGETLALLPRLARHAPVVLVVRHTDLHAARRVTGTGATRVLVFEWMTDAELIGAVRDAIARAPGLPRPRTEAQAIATEPPAGPALRRDAVKRLSPREVEVLRHMAQGLRNSAIAHHLYLSEKTVKNHINRIFAKLEVESRAQAILLWHGALES